MAVTTQHGYHYGNGFNYPVTSTCISEDFPSPDQKRWSSASEEEKNLDVVEVRWHEMSKHDFVV